MTQNAIVTDLNRCVGCLACCTACKTVNDVPLGSFWTKVLRIGPNPKYEGAINPDVEMYFLPLGCQHCAKPECVKVCPTGASQKVANGSVQIDKEKCIGCQFCVMACPYGVRYLNKTEKVVEKCTLCNQLVEAGSLPQCVVACGGRARYFGDLDKGIKTFEGIAPAEAVNDSVDGQNISYEQMRAKHVTLGESVRPFGDADVYHLPDVGNGPSFRYILRNKKWQG
ncbi:MAG: 4Fe-4S dicluster domain-containing protein [Coriobacteriales bacterium]|nr:4Fe-4S dicluster domain-containing protein [Coriobacteriales bacterium]